MTLSSPGQARLSDLEVRRLVAKAEARIAAAVARLWPRSDVAFRMTVAVDGAFRRQVSVDGRSLCATVRPEASDLTRMAKGDHEALTTVLAATEEGAQSRTEREAEQLQALATYSTLRVATPVAYRDGVMFTPWVTGTSLAGRLRADPAMLTELLAALMDDLAELHHNPADQLLQVAAPMGGRTAPRMVTDALSRLPADLPTAPVTAGEAGQVRALVGTLSVRLGRLAAQLDPTMFARAGLAFGLLAPSRVRYRAPEGRAVLGSADLGPGGDIVDNATLLGHLHLLTVAGPPPLRAELADGIEAWLSGRLAACRGTWREWL
ncbi:hypothetical protein, partial [Frankia sp. KB5]|uniref:hypothetical protein n=1 Tax=Frankia sp. KB5 TaxID=683318 RepID=UPI000A10983A